MILYSSYASLNIDYDLRINRYNDLHITDSLRKDLLLMVLVTWRLLPWEMRWVQLWRTFYVYMDFFRYRDILGYLEFFFHTIKVVTVLSFSQFL